MSKINENKVEYTFVCIIDIRGYKLGYSILYTKLKNGTKLTSAHYNMRISVCRYV